MNISDNLVRFRRARGLTQEALAEKSEISLDVIARLEQGRKSSARWSTLTALAAALQVPVSRLVDAQPIPPARNGIAAFLLPLRRAIVAITDPPATASGGNLPDAVDRCATAYRAGEFNAVAQALPDVLLALRRWSAEPWAGAPLVRGLILAAGLVMTAGYGDLAFSAASEAVDTATRIGDPIARAEAVSTLSWVLRRQGRPDDAESTALAAAAQIEPTFGCTDPNQLAVYGMLLIRAASAAARAGEFDRAAEHLALATAVADRGDIDHRHGRAGFGPRVVGIYLVSHHLESGDFVEALRRSEELPAQPAAVPAIWEARYQLNLAYAYAQVDDYSAAIDHLWSARTTANEWIRYHPLAPIVVGEVVQQPGTLCPRITQLGYELPLP